MRLAHGMLVELLGELVTAVRAAACLLSQPPYPPATSKHVCSRNQPHYSHPPIHHPGRIRTQVPISKYAPYVSAARLLEALAPRFAARLLPEAPGGGDPGER